MRNSKNTSGLAVPLQLPRSQGQPKGGGGLAQRPCRCRRNVRWWHRPELEVRRLRPGTRRSHHLKCPQLSPPRPRHMQPPTVCPASWCQQQQQDREAPWRPAVRWHTALRRLPIPDTLLHIDPMKTFTLCQKSAPSASLHPGWQSCRPVVYPP